MEGKFKTRAEAIEDALSKLEVGNKLIVSSACGRVEYILELKSKESCVE